MEPPVKFWNGRLAKELPEGGRLTEACGLVVEHHIVAVGNAHEIGAARRSEEGCQVFNVVLVGLHVVGIAGVAAHGKPQELAHKVILQSRPGHLAGVVEVLRADEAHHRVHQEG